MPTLRPGGCGCLVPGGAADAAWYDRNRGVWEHPAMAWALGPLPTVIAAIQRGEQPGEAARQTACQYARGLPGVVGISATIGGAAGAGALIGTAVSGLGGIPFAAIAAAAGTISAVAGALLPLAIALCEQRQFTPADAARAARVAAEEAPKMSTGSFSSGALGAARIAGSIAPTGGISVRVGSSGPPGIAAAQAAARAAAERAKVAAGINAARAAAAKAGCADTGRCPSVDLCGEIWGRSPSTAEQLRACQATSPAASSAPVPSKGGGGGVAILAALAALQALR